MSFSEKRHKNENSLLDNPKLWLECAELDETLNGLIEKHCEDQVELQRALEHIYRLLQEKKIQNLRFGASFFRKLIDSLLVRNERVRQSPQLVANVLACVKLYIQISADEGEDGKLLLNQLLSFCQDLQAQPNIAQILVKMFDDFEHVLGVEFVCSDGLYCILQRLLQSERQDRISAYFIMEKLHFVIIGADSTDEMLTETLKRWGWSDRDQYEQYWRKYIRIWKHLEEQDPKLVVETLHECVPHILKIQISNTWLRILFINLLRDNQNILVKRGTLEYVVKYMTMSELIQMDVLHEFLMATNKSELYNFEDYFLPSIDMKRFLMRNEKPAFMETLVTIDWRPVALLYWVRSLEPEQLDELPTIDKAQLIKLAECVRGLKNWELRDRANEHLLETFTATINSLSFKDYMDFIDALFNVGDTFLEFKCLADKIEKCKHIGIEMQQFDKRYYDKVVGLNFRYRGLCHDFVVGLIKKLKGVPQIQHGWWRFFIVFHWYYLPIEIKEEYLEFIRTEYDINIELLQNCKDPKELQMHLLDKLSCRTEEEISLVKARSVDIFVTLNIKKWSNIEELNLTPLELLDEGTQETYASLTKILQSHTERLKDDAVLLRLVELLKKYLGGHQVYDTISCILSYAHNHLSTKEYEQLVANILNVDRSNWWLTNMTFQFENIIPRPLRIRGIIYSLPTTGEARIESAYEQSYFDKMTFVPCLRYIISMEVQEEVNAIIEELLCINNQLTEALPDYSELSMEHRIKIRIARALLGLTNSKQYWSEHLWTALFAPKDQLNVSYMFECLVARQLPELAMLLKRLKSLLTFEPRQRLSLISVAHIYCMTNLDKLSPSELQEVVSLLLPQITDANCEAQLLAQMVIHRLAVKCEECSITLPVLVSLKTDIGRALGDEIEKYEEDARLILPDIFNESDLILYITNAPFDEYNLNTFTYTNEPLKLKLKTLRCNFVAQQKNRKKEATLDSLKRNSTNIPGISDLFPESNLTST
ncbi:uncharacterized protein LOC115623958 [Scaptodrosophila lebanonensis]|uniref:Uncharacterized protein LOC115623958 n=1 Tax=Drosophila lebanonensis TaxID=7225 RepID=A0A6J2TEF9_DROLE|nr:uncharacterized protein LOC115623958 [Scaptodrosophila lebanonensis]